MSRLKFLYNVYVSYINAPGLFNFGWQMALVVPWDVLMDVHGTQLRQPCFHVHVHRSGSTDGTRLLPESILTSVQPCNIRPRAISQFMLKISMDIMDIYGYPGYEIENYQFKITTVNPRGQCDKRVLLERPWRISKASGYTYVYVALIFINENNLCQNVNYTDKTFLV